MENSRKSSSHQSRHDYERKFSILGKTLVVCLLVLVAESVVLQSDGKIVAAGYSHNGTNNDFAVVRYNTDGSLDTTFDTDGKVTTPFSSGNNDLATSVVLQSDGKIVAAGYSHNGTNNDFAVVRYNTDGSLDTTFDTDGKVTTPFSSGNNDLATSVVLQSDGKIVAAGYSHNGTNNDFAVVRYNTDGSLDTTFDTDGKVTTPVGSGNDFAESVVLQSDGKIVAAGYSHNGTNNDFAVVRYNTDGSLDTTFDTDGKVTTPFSSGNNDLATSVVLQSDGKIVAAGYSHNGTNNDFAVVRYNTDGSLDTTFDTDGKVTTPVGSGNDFAESVVLQSDGKIVAVGYSYNGTNYDFAGVSYNTDGSLEAIITTPVGSGDDEAFSVVLQSDGKIVAAGYSHNGTNNDFAVVRYTANTPAPEGDSGSDSSPTTKTITPVVVKVADSITNMKNKTYLSKYSMKLKLRENNLFKYSASDSFKYQVFKSSKKSCGMRGNYVMRYENSKTCDLYITRTNAKGISNKYWVKINYNK
jgi:uncharacterized delta-60 repeat protein